MNNVFNRKPVKHGRTTNDEKIHEFPEREGRPEAAPIRDWIEYWHGQLPATKQRDIRGRLHSGDIHHFTSAYFELQMFAMLRTMGYEVTVEPTLAAGRYNPDFLVKQGDDRFYLEATVCGQDAGDLRGTSNEMDAVEKIRSAFENARVDLHSHLWLEAEGNLNQTLSKNRVAKPFTDLLRRTTAAEVQESYESNPYGHLHRTEFGAELKCDDWTLQGVVEPTFHVDGPGHVWGPVRWAMGDASEAIRTSLVEKATQWRRMGPSDGILVVAISVCHSQFSWNDGDETRAITEDWTSGNPTAYWRDELKAVSGILLVGNISLGYEQVTRARLVPNPERCLPESLAPLMTENRLAVFTGVEDAGLGAH